MKIKNVMDIVEELNLSPWKTQTDNQLNLTEDQAKSILRNIVLSNREIFKDSKYTFYTLHIEIASELGKQNKLCDSNFIIYYDDVDKDYFFGHNLTFLLGEIFFELCCLG